MTCSSAIFSITVFVLGLSITWYFIFTKPKFLSEQNGKELNTIIFDFDGTIVDSFSLVYSIIQSTEYSEDLNPPDEIRKKKLSDFVKHSGLSVLKLTEMGDYILSEYEKKNDTISLFDGIKEVLEYIHQTKKIEMAIVTRNKKEVVKNFLKSQGLGEYFNLGVFSTKHAVVKGKKKVIKHFLMYERKYTNEILFIGDEVGDIASCNKLGIDAIAVSYGFNSRDVLESENPKFIADNPKELLSIIKSILE